jgi:SAM-dependent methyltransferase
MSFAGWALRRLGSMHGRAVHGRRVQALAAHFAELIPHGHSVLDVGCGDGAIDRLLLERRQDLHIAGVEALVRPTTQIPVTSFDGTQLPFGDKSWDTVMFCDVLHHTDDPVGLLREAARVARHSVIIKDHLAEGASARWLLRFMDFVGNAPHGVRQPHNYFNRAQWTRAYRHAGLLPAETKTRLVLYPAWADPIFGQSLHFISRCDVIDGLPGDENH